MGGAPVGDGVVDLGVGGGGLHPVDLHLAVAGKGVVVLVVAGVHRHRGLTGERPLQLFLAAAAIKSAAQPRHLVGDLQHCPVRRLPLHRDGHRAAEHVPLGV